MGSQETADARNKKVISAFLLPESRKAYRDRTTFIRKKGRWRAIAESKMAGLGLQYFKERTFSGFSIQSGKTWQSPRILITVF